MAGSRESDISESSSVVSTIASCSEIIAKKMRTCTIFFVALAVVLLCTEYVSAMEVCPWENCLSPNKCMEQVKNQNVLCFQQGTVCCSVVKHEYRTHCHHFGGECMHNCPALLTRKSVDCKEIGKENCCVLV